MLRMYIGLVVVAAVWGANFGVARFAMESFSPELLTFLRFALTLPLFFLLLKWKEGSFGIEWRDAGKLIVIGFVGVAVLEIAVMYSIQYTTLANASLLNVAPWPIFAALFAPLFTGEKITRRLAVGGMFAMVGVVLIILGGGEGFNLGSDHMLGNALAFGVSIIGALYNLALMPLMKKYSALRVSAWSILFGSLLLFPFTLGSWGKVEWTSVGLPVWGAVVYNVLFCTFLAFLIWNFCMQHVGAARANFFRYVVPAAAVVTGYIMFRETIELSQMIGGALIAAGLVWISLERTKVLAVQPLMKREMSS